MFKFINNWRRKKVINQSQITDETWEQSIKQLAILDRLTEGELSRLSQLATVFLHEKTFTGAHDLPISEEMKRLIALQACLPILNLGMDWYSGWSGIIVYPAGFTTERTVVDEFGVSHVINGGFSGEAWQRGPVVLSWQDTEHAARIDGNNVVVHEFVHKLDMLNGEANGFPPMHNNITAKDWSHIFTDAFEDFQRSPKKGLDRYGATAPAEFLAVMSEVFFEQPETLNDAYPEVYQTMSSFFKQNPIEAIKTARD